MSDWVWWLIGAVVLAAAETVSGDLILVMLAGGAAAGGAAAALGVDSLVLQTLVAALVAVGLLLGVRPAARRRLGIGAGAGGAFGVDRLIGREAEVLVPVDGRTGRVRLHGQEWSARSMDPGAAYPAGEFVRVVSIDGAVAVVWEGP